MDDMFSAPRAGASTTRRPLFEGFSGSLQDSVFGEILMDVLGKKGEKLAASPPHHEMQSNGLTWTASAGVC